MTTRTVWRALLVTAALGLAADQASAQTALARVRTAGQLRIGTDATYPPFASAQGGEFSGFDIDLGRALARELGVTPVFVNASFDGIFPALQNGSFDVVLSAVTITPERRAVLLFSDPYIDAGQLLAVRKDRQDIRGPADLSGKRVGVQINTTAQFDLEKRAGVAVAKYNTIDLALLDLENGRIDAVVGDAPVLRYMTALSFKGLKTAGDQFTDEKLGIVLARGSEDLRRAVNAALWKLEDSGEYARVYRQWFGERRRGGSRGSRGLERRQAVRSRTGVADLALPGARRVDDRRAGRARTDARSADWPRPGPGPRAAGADLFGAGRGLCGSRARHATARADLVHLLRPSRLRRQPAGLHERRHRAHAEFRRLPRRDLPRRDRVDRDRADGGGTLPRDDLRAGHAARDPAADLPPRPAATHE
jgi:ABC-type amino acid transport substrate-binding protein